MKWLKAMQVSVFFIESELGSPSQNGFCESFNGNMRNECSNINVNVTIIEADYVIQGWVKYYNAVRAAQLARWGADGTGCSIAHVLQEVKYILGIVLKSATKF